MKIAGCHVTAQKGRRSMSEAQLRAEISRAFEDAREFPCFLCIEDGLFSMVVLGPRHPSRSTWVFEIVAPTYRKLRAAMRDLGLTSKLRERDFQRRWAA